MVSTTCYPPRWAQPATAVYKGYNMTISVQLQNQGSIPQTFTLFVYANGTAIYSEQVSNLSSPELTTIRFNFTANLAYGNYSMSACGQPIKFVKIIKVGDLGSRVYNATTKTYQNEFGVFDGLVNGVDLNLFLQCYHGTAPAQWMYLGDLGSRVYNATSGQYQNVLGAFDGIVNSVDLNLEEACLSAGKNVTPR